MEAGSNNVQFLLLIPFSVRAKDSISHRKTLRDPKFIIMIQVSSAVAIRPGFQEWEAVKCQPLMRIEAGVITSKLEDAVNTTLCAPKAAYEESGRESEHP